MHSSFFFKAALTSIAVAMSITVSGCGSLHAEAGLTPTTLGSQAQAGYYRQKIGDVEVIALSDGTVPIDAALLKGDSLKIQASLAQAYDQSQITTSVNAFLIKSGSKMILVDAGTAELFGPGMGKIPNVLRSLGISTTQITDILVTHIHTDHTGGLMVGNSRVYPNAVVHVEKKEVAFWLDPANKAIAAADQKIFFDQAVAKFSPYVASGQVVIFDGATELFAGIRSVPAPGHTPGHSFYQLESKGEKLMFWGDVMHVAAVQLPDPDVTIQFDVDPTQARAQRAAAFADAASKGYMVAPAHVSFPGFGHMRKDAVGNGYRLYPVPYLNDAPTAAN